MATRTEMKTADVADLALADAGRLKIEWADRQMPVLAGIRERFERERPLDGWRISACLHVTAETANLMRTLAAGGADAVLCSSNPLSTQDDVAASLVTHFEIPTFAIKGEDRDSYYRHIGAALDHRPQVTMDDGADLVNELHTTRRELLDEVVGGTEETTTGVIRLRAMADAGQARLPGGGRQRGAHQAPVRQPLRHRPERDRRHPARDEHPLRRQDGRGRRLRLGRPRDRVARARHGRQRRRLRGRPDPRASRRRWTASAS